MLVANAVVDTDQPRLQVGENQMDDRQVLLGNLWITTLGNSEPPVDMMDKPLRALPTSPQAQQQQQEDRMKGILAA